jgi:ribosome modulation factor
MRRKWTPGAAAKPTALMSEIGRAHLDRARSEGAEAGSNPTKSVGGCPYDGRARPMTTKAWENGFQLSRSGAVGTP